MEAWEPYLLSFSVAPEKGYTCLTETLGIKFIHFNRPVSLSIGFIGITADQKKKRYLGMIDQHTKHNKNIYFLNEATMA